MEIDPEHGQVVICTALEYGKVADGTEPVIEQRTGNKTDDKGYHGVGGKTAHANADRSKQSCKQEEPEIGPGGGAGVYARSGSQVVDGEIIHECGHQGNESHDKASQELAC